MSRHSKNCTAHSVFTYNEKKKLKEYGTQQERLGSDCFRNFNCCHLCLQPAHNACCCVQGHLFCRECVVISLVDQKTTLKQQYNQWLSSTQLAQQQQQYSIQQEQQQKQEQFHQMEYLSDPSAKGKSRQQEAIEQLYQPLSQHTLQTQKTIKEMEEQQIECLLTPTLQKTKNNFWGAQNFQPLPHLPPAKPTMQTKCPADHSHPLSIQQLFYLQPTLDYITFKFNCQLCAKELNYQKVQAVRTCGHLFCKHCMHNILLKDQLSKRKHKNNKDNKDNNIKDKFKCTCNQSFKMKDLVDIQQGQTAYTNHNEVQAKKASVAFLI